METTDNQDASDLVIYYLEYLEMFMNDLCFSNSRAIIDLRQNNFGILMHRPWHSSSEFFKCQVTLVSPKKSSIVLSLYNYGLSADEHLTIEDSDGYTVKLIGSGFFKDERKSIISSEKMIISYTSRNSSSSNEFQFTFTRVHDSPCYANEFQCKNGKCILKELACNKHNHCGDNSDQIKCVPETPGNSNKPEHTVVKSKYNLLIVLVAVLASLLFIISLVFIVVIIYFRNTKKPHIPDNSETRQTGINNSLQSIASTIPQQDIQPSAVTTQQASSERPETFYNRVCRSFRNGNNSNRIDEVPVHQEIYQVPSMYPKLDLTPSAPELNGVENQSFKIEE